MKDVMQLIRLKLRIWANKQKRKLYNLLWNNKWKLVGLLLIFYVVNKQQINSFVPKFAFFSHENKVKNIKTDEAGLMDMGSVIALVKGESSKAKAQTVSQKSVKSWKDEDKPIAKSIDKNVGNTYSNVSFWSGKNEISDKRSQKRLIQNNYVNHFVKMAQAETEKFAVPTSIILAQGILESNAGGSSLAKNNNNHFGIKCHNWTGASFYAIDDDKDEDGNLIESCFRTYDAADESWRDHSIFLQQPRYQLLYDCGLDYRAWAFGLQTAGYATDPEYANKLISIIERYELYKLDGMSSPIVAPVAPPSEEGMSAPIEQKQPKKVKRTEDTPNDGTLFEIVPNDETSFDEKISIEEKSKPAAEKIPSEYLRGQGRKILEGLFNNLRKVDFKKEKSLPQNDDNLDEITPNKVEQNQKLGSFTPKGGILYEKVVAMR